MAEDALSVSRRPGRTPLSDVRVGEPQEAEIENGNRRKPRRDACRCPSATPVSSHRDRARCRHRHGPHTKRRRAVSGRASSLTSEHSCAGAAVGEVCFPGSCPGAREAACWAGEDLTWDTPRKGLVSSRHRTAHTAQPKPPTDVQRGHRACVDTPPKRTDGRRQTPGKKLIVPDQQSDANYSPKEVPLTPVRTATLSASAQDKAGEDAGKGPSHGRWERRRARPRGKRRGASSENQTRSCLRPQRSHRWGPI